jgi:hypothetical protein
LADDIVVLQTGSNGAEFSGKGAIGKDQPDPVNIGGNLVALAQANHYNHPDEKQLVFHSGHLLGRGSDGNRVDAPSRSQRA